MILKHRSFDLYGKLLFETATIQPPFKRSSPMPDEACFLYVVEGSLLNSSAQEQLRLQADEAVLMKCGNYVSQMLPSAEKGRYEAVAIHFYPDVMKRVFDHSLPSAFKNPNRKPEAGMASVQASTLVKKYIESLLFYFKNPQLVTEDLLALKLREIILLLLQTENAPKVMEVLSNLFSKQSFQFKEVIEAHIFSNVTLPQLAELTNLSLSSFKREFKRLYKNSPANYMRQRKLTRAADLLSVSDRPISEVAFDSGFNDLAYFSKAFKTHFGNSPTDYRMSHNGN